MVNDLLIAADDRRPKVCAFAKKVKLVFVVSGVLNVTRGRVAGIIRESRGIAFKRRPCDDLAKDWRENTSIDILMADTVVLRLH
jgi:hypothetical protein